jgi:hypothetical protein
MLLYVVVGTAAVVGIAGTIFSAREANAVGLILFALLFSPVICLLALNNLWVRTTCVFDRNRELVEIDEQSYTRRVHESYPLHDVSSIAVRALPDARLLGSALNFGLVIVMPQVEYLAACGNNEAILSQAALHVSRFLGVQLETPLGTAQVSRHHVSPGLVLVPLALYLFPTFLTISALVVLYERLPNVQPSLVGLVGAIVVSQVGAILAFTYYRARRHQVV